MKGGIRVKLAATGIAVLAASGIASGVAYANTPASNPVPHSVAAVQNTTTANAPEAAAPKGVEADGPGGFADPAGANNVNSTGGHQDPGGVDAGGNG